MAGFDAIVTALLAANKVKDALTGWNQGQQEQFYGDVAQEAGPQTASAYRNIYSGAGPGGKVGGSIGILPGRERIARDVIKRGLKEPWFHGTNGEISQILGSSVPPRLAKEYPTEYWELASKRAQGFDPSRIGSSTGTRLGEPAGVSLTRDPEVARKFGTVLRVGVDTPPSTVGQFVDPEFQRLFKEAYQKARLPEMGPITSPQDLVSRPQMFNQRMSDYLRSQGVEAIAYNPRRWREFELRVLDPKKAVPFGTMPNTPGVGRSAWASGQPLSPEEATFKRYMEGSDPWRKPGGFTSLRKSLWDSSPEFPSRLHDLISQISD